MSGLDLQRFLRIGAVALLVCVALPQCAYFNTFYLAKQNFNDGERFRKRDGVVKPENKKFYTAAIENASIILQDYRTSSYVDDSLYIIGLSYLYTGEYVLARTKFDELITAFPQSDLAEESKYYRAQCLMELGQSDDARIALNDLMVSGSHGISGKAGLLLAEISCREEQWDDTITTADAVIAASPERDVLRQALIYRGEGLFHLEKYEEAVTVFQGLLKEDISPTDRFSVGTMTAQGLARLDREDDALALLQSFQNKGNMAQFAPGLRLEIGKIYELKGEDQKAVDAFRTMAADFPDSTQAQEAWYHVGMITLHDITKAQDARDAFSRVAGKKKVAETWYTDAAAKVVEIDSLRSRLSRIGTLGDKPDALARERFLLAELLTYSLGLPDAALEQHRLILEEAPNSEYAIRSRFLMGMSDLEKSGASTDAAERKLMEDIMASSPQSDFSQELRVRLGLIDLPPDIALMKKAEDARLGGSSPDIYLPLYQAVADSFPKMRSGYQARFVIAWCYEHEKNDRDKGLGLYKQLADEPVNDNNRVYVGLASAKLAMIMDELKIITESKKNIASYDAELEQLGQSNQSRMFEMLNQSLEGGSGMAGERKIRERNERIRSRYYSN
jgi:TolA-binding protein